VEHVLWVIAVLSNWTVISRIIFTWMELSKVNILMPITPSFQAENTVEQKHPIEC